MEVRRRGSTLAWMTLLPPLLVAFLVWLLASDVPYWDDWGLVPLLVKAKAGAAGFADYFEIFDVHRYLLPKFILTQVALATGWNVRVQLLLNVLVVCTTLAAVASISARSAGGGVRSGAMAGSALALFSLAQYDNWLWSIQIAYFLSIALAVWAIAVLSRPGWTWRARAGVAALLCAMATFSVGFGIVSWVALAPLVWIEAPRRRLAIAAWGLLALSCTALYVAGAELPAGTSGGAARLGEVALFFVTVAGTPWTSVAVPAFILGALSIALFVALSIRALRSDPADAMPWIALGLMALGFAGLTALVRSRLGWSVAESPRYATPMLLLTVATLHLAARVDRERRRVSLVGLLVGILLFANISFLPIFWTTAASRHVNRVCTDLAFVLGDARSDCVPSGGPHADLPETMETARAEGLRPFADRAWFSTVEVPARNLRVTATGSRLSIGGESAPSLLPAPVVVTRGPAREPIALGWASLAGRWTVRIDSRLHRPPEVLEVWTIPRHQKRLVRIARWSVGNS